MAKTAPLTDYDVEVKRTAWGFQTVRVRAASAREAAERAVTESANREYTSSGCRYDPVAVVELGPIDPADETPDTEGLAPRKEAGTACGPTPC